MIRSLLLATAALAAFPAIAQTPPPATATPAPAAQTPDAQIPDAQLARFFQDFDAAELDRSPLSKAYRGIRDEDYGEWDDMSEAAQLLDHQADVAALEEMRSRFGKTALSPASKLSYDLFEKMIERRSNAFRFRQYSYTFDQMNGAQSDLPAFLINIHKVTNKADAEAYVARLKGLGPALDQVLAVSARRADKGITPPRWVYPYVIDDARNVVSGFPFTKIMTEAPLYADLKAKVAALGIPQAEKDALLAAGTDALLTGVRPAYLRVIAEMERQQKLAGTDDGVWRFPDGAAYYAERLANYTTTGYTPAKIHQLGLDNVARIHGEMREIMRRTGFKGDLQAFFAFMRSDKRFYASNDQAGRDVYLAETEKAKQAVTAKLPQWFGTLPQAPLVVKPVEPFREKSAGKAFYQDPAPDGSRPGTYYVNLYDMAEMPLFELEALFYHEGIPGHHLQLAIQTELKDIPAFRQFGDVTAYTEGWGLYAEKLGKDMGLYEDPYRDFGRLQLELHRAIRLVVDSGLHDKKWTREQAIKYVEDNSADAPGGIVKAIERYIVFPGQATAYLVGRLKISELRAKAEKALGDRYDVRGFHDAVLRNGPVPLDVLEKLVDDWIASRKRS